jgi:Skp family chaperone for outer membrane proteins
LHVWYQNRLSASAFARIQAECDALQTELESLAAAATAAVQKRAAAELQCAALEKSLKETEMTAGQQAKEIEKTLAALKVRSRHLLVYTFIPLELILYS